MLSFGIEYERAFSIAFCRARLPAGSGPPSFAATMIARESLEKSLPRFASAAPFLCLIADHLLCPDTDRLPHGIEEQLVHARIFRQLGVERRDEEATLPQEDRLTLVLCQDLDVRPCLAHARRTDEDAAKRLVIPSEPEIRLEARHLAAVGVPVDFEVDHAEMLAVEDDHARARTEHGPGERAQRLVEPVQAHQPHERGRLAARNDEPVEPVELLRLAYFDDVCAEPAQHRRVLADVSLDGENSDLHARNASHDAALTCFGEAS